MHLMQLTTFDFDVMKKKHRISQKIKRKYDS